LAKWKAFTQAFEELSGCPYASSDSNTTRRKINEFRDMPPRVNLTPVNFIRRSAQGHQSAIANSLQGKVLSIF
jgi:hypothetical protein